jgi:hypothetical protein
MKICLPCDRGNIYCSERCAEIQRRCSLRRAGKKYQGTFKGRRKHAARQNRHRQGQKKKVTHQGTQPGLAHGFLERNKKQEELQATYLQPEPEAQEKAHQEILLQSKPETPGIVRCDICGCWCGPFARQRFWHGGRNFKKLERKYHDSKRNRGRDSPFTQGRRLVSEHNSKPTAASLFNSKESA